MRHHLPTLFLLLTPAPLLAEHARSVHLHYEADPGTAFYNEVVVDRTTAGTYVMVCGWEGGYCGIQDLGNGKRLIIFSVWDSDRNDSAAVAGKDQARAVYADPALHVSRFGGEGSGLHALGPFDWSVEKPYAFLVTASGEKGRTDYSGHVYLAEQKRWKHLVTFSVPRGDGRLRGYYSFIEDFSGNPGSSQRPRQAHYRNGWVKVGAEWKRLSGAVFTADQNNAVVNFGAGADPYFYLATGGEAPNAARLNGLITLPEEARKTPLPALPVR